MYARKDIERIFNSMNSLTDRLQDLQQDLMPDSFHVERQVEQLRATLQHIERAMESEIAKVQ
jgi:ABC-type transporter Mla subunit MlaD